ncbi:hypothetical protein ACFHYQ_28245 [Sphaerimonospora cavernae]|uniref:Ankyrin repeat domain-containing protein n=1 Tax=Sphaerimonospora cavernae TaxID=1740611 RepID=A0ABV6UDC0_9ACTN
MQAKSFNIGIERPNGRLVDLLLEAGHPVVPDAEGVPKHWAVHFRWA